MTKEQFEKLSVDHKFLIISQHQDLLSTAVHSRQQLLPTIAGMSAALLVVATFNDNLIPLDVTIRIILSIFLLIIPVSLYLYNIDLKKAQKKNRDYIEELLGITEKLKITTKDKIIARAPDIIIFILMGVCVIIIYKILENIC